VNPTLFVLTQGAATPTPGVESPAGIIAITIGVLTLVWLVLLKPAKDRRKKRRDPLKRPATSSPQRSLAAERSTERQMQSLVLELEQLSRTMAGQLDAKAAKLEALIAQANDAADRLESASRPAGPEAPPNRLAGELAEAVRNGKSGPAESGLAGLSAHRDIYALADAGEPLAKIAQKTKRPAGEVELILALRGT